MQNALVLYDSFFGNTEKIAMAIAEGLKQPDWSVKLLRATKNNIPDLTSLNLLIIGSPTQGGKPTPTLKEILDAIPQDALKGISVATFDTRFHYADKGAGMRLLMKVINFAAGKMEKTLTDKGGSSVAEPEGFFVLDKEGPLKDGEIERATNWARSILKKIPIQ